MAKALKTAKMVLLTLVQHDWGRNERTVAYVRATTQGRQAELRFVGDNAVRRFKTIHDAHHFLRKGYYHEHPMTFFDVPKGVEYPIG